MPAAAVKQSVPAGSMSANTGWLHWAFAGIVCTAVAITAIQLARVDAGLGAPYGPERTIAAIDASAMRGRAERAVALDALRARPVDGAAYRVLAQVEEQAGRDAQAAALFATAVERWPRERVARAALIDRAFARGDIEVAFEHIDALLRVAPSLRTPLLNALAPHLVNAPVRDALVARLAAAPPWRGSVPAVLLAPDTPIADAEAVLSALASRLDPTPGELQARLTLLERLGEPGRARAIWLATLPPADRAASTFVFDGGFERAGVVGGYAWQLNAPAGASIGYEGYGAYEGESMLSIHFDGRAVQFNGVRQLMALEPGQYRLDMVVRHQVDTSRPFLWQVACAAPDRRVLAELALPGVSATEWKRGEVSFEVPQACPSQTLALRHSARSLAERRMRGDLHIDAVRVEAVNQDFFPE